MPIVEKQDHWVEASQVGASLFVCEIVTREEAAGRLGVSRSTMYGWTQEREKTGFPLPLHGSEALGGGSPVYHFPTVATWYKEYERLKPKGGAPKKQVGY